MSDLQEKMADFDKRFDATRKAFDERWAKAEREEEQVWRVWEARLVRAAYVLFVLLLLALVTGLVVAVWRLALGGVW